MIQGPAGLVAKVKPLICPNCGGQIELRGYGAAINAVCGNCQTVLDTTSPSLAVLQQFPKRVPIPPKIPLGSRGKGVSRDPSIQRKAHICDISRNDAEDDSGGSFT